MNIDYTGINKVTNMATEMKSDIMSRENSILIKETEISLLFIFAIANSEESSSCYLPKDVVSEILKTKIELHAKDAKVRAITYNDNEMLDEISHLEKQCADIKALYDDIVEFKKLYPVDQEDVKQMPQAEEIKKPENNYRCSIQ